jgi:hypothetical protein|tara:strand:- start:7515 stop:7721 length:207 start_codon:yes stop_codon:yes gene_type:complete
MKRKPQRKKQKDFQKNIKKQTKSMLKKRKCAQCENIFDPVEKDFDNWHVKIYESTKVEMFCKDCWNEE